MNDLLLILISFLYILLILGISDLVEKNLKEKSELPRKIVHILLGNWVFILPLFRSLAAAMFLPLLFIVVNYISARYKLIPSIEREGENTYGTVYYAISLSILTFISYILQMWMFAFIGILVMAYGDGFAGLVGNKYGARKIPFAKGKSLEGSSMVFIFTFIITLIIPLYYSGNLDLPFNFFLIIALANAIYSTLLELSVSDGFDNLLLPLGSGIFAGLLLYFFSRPQILLIVIASLIVFFSYKKRAISLDGGLIAILTAQILYVFGGVHLDMALIAFFVLGSVASRFSNEEKEKIKKRERAEKNGRNRRQVVCNSLPAVLIAFYSYFGKDEILLLAYVVFAAAAADTFASEIGSLTKGKVISLIGFKEVPKGLSGGVSLLGLVASLVGSLLLALFAGFEFGYHGVVFCFKLGFLGSIIDSILGSLFQKKYLAEDGTLQDKANKKGDPVVKGLPFVTNNLVNIVTLFIVTIVGYFMMY